MLRQSKKLFEETIENTNWMTMSMPMLLYWMRTWIIWTTYIVFLRFGCADRTNESDKKTSHHQEKAIGLQPIFNWLFGKIDFLNTKLVQSDLNDDEYRKCIAFFAFGGEGRMVNNVVIIPMVFAH